MYSVCAICSKSYERRYEKGTMYTPPVCGYNCFHKFINNNKYSKRKFSITDAGISAYSDSDYVMRSSYELEFAKILNINTDKFDKYYEPYSFKLSNGMLYVPDFFYKKTSMFFEVKGLWEVGAWVKFNLFMRDFGFSTYLVTKSFMQRIKYGKISK